MTNLKSYSFDMVCIVDSVGSSKQICCKNYSHRLSIHADNRGVIESVMRTDVSQIRLPKLEVFFVFIDAFSNNYFRSILFSSFCKDFSSLSDQEIPIIFKFWKSRVFSKA